MRIPIGSVTEAADHMIPGIGIQPGTSGSRAKIAIYYYHYPNNACDLETCRLDVGYVSSVNGGRTWSAPSRLAVFPSARRLPGVSSDLAGVVAGNGSGGRVPGDLAAITL